MAHPSKGPKPSFSVNKKPASKGAGMKVSKVTHNPKKTKGSNPPKANK